MTTPEYWGSRTVKVEGGLRARSTRGDIGESWWSKRFLAVLESFALGTRLTRGRNYARAGQVLSLTVEPGEVAAVVQGSRPTPYQVSIALQVFGDDVWGRVEAALAAEALGAAKLLAGELPPHVEDVFADADAPLFPSRVYDLAMRCSCPDAAVPCKHLAAAFYLLAERFDADPFQILLWRGRGRETLLANLRALRTGTAAVAATATATGPAEPVLTGAARVLADMAEPEVEPERFWYPPVPLAEPEPGAVTGRDLLLRQLPTPPPALGGRDLLSALRSWYR
ncbi:SWIM zinc finger family protein [Dactylosporangium sp. CA-152071]|uniref:SWIM zinc finger family protein n=1 Tax=Dactylosporangium sp. CA-152071 TaxID=3239933 RepID=UPI003D8C8ED9